MIDNIFGRHKVLSVTPQQMKRDNTSFNLVSQNLTSFNNDSISLINPNIMGSIPTNILGSSGVASIGSIPDSSRKSPTQQIMELGKKYKIPYSGNISTYQQQVIKAVIMHKAIQYDVPLNVALGICGNESSWSMWSNVSSGKLEQCKNIRSGKLSSSDWGAMQINDKAHPEAFPRAKLDLEFNIDYGLRFLSKKNNKVSGDLKLGFGDWDRTIASYNLGHNPTTQKDYEIAKNYVSRVKNKSLRV